MEEFSTLSKLAVGYMTRFAYLHHQYFVEQTNSDGVCVSKCCQFREQYNLGHEKVYKLFGKSFPNPPNNLEKTPSFDAFMDSLPHLRKTIEPFYALMVEIMEFHDMARSKLKSILVESNEMEFNSHPVIIDQVLTLVANYVKLHLYWKDSLHITSIISLYKFSSNELSGVSLEQVNQLISYMDTFRDNPLRVIQDELKGRSAKKLGEVLLSLQNVLLIARDESKMHNLNMFHIDKLLSENFPTDKIYENFMYAGKIPEWVVYGCLCIPDELANAELLHLVDVVGRDCFVVPIFRKKVLSFHNVLGDIFSGKNYQAPACAPKLKKSISSISKTCVKRAGIHHRRLRKFMSWALHNMNTAMEHCSALLGPKLPIILAGLVLVKAEVLWLCYHYNQSIPSRVKSKHYCPSHYSEEDIPQLIHEMDRLMFHLREHYPSIIVPYYKKFLTKIHADSLKDLSECLRDRISDDYSFDDRMLTLFESLSQRIVATDGGPQLENLVALRSDWDRISSYLLRSNVSFDTEDLHDTMNTIVLHSKILDSFGTVLQDFVSIKEFWWFRDEYAEIFDKAVNGLISPVWSSFGLAMIRILCTFENGNELFCPEEKAFLCESLHSFVQYLFKKLESHIEKLFHGMLFETKRLHQKLSPYEASMRYKRQQRKQDQRLLCKADTISPKDGDVPPPEPLPGIESRPWAEHFMQNYLNQEHRILSLLQFFTDIPAFSLPFMQTSYHPAMLVRNCLARVFRSSLRRRALALYTALPTAPAPNNNMNASSMKIQDADNIRKHISLFLCTTQKISATLPVEIIHDLHTVLYEECSMGDDNDNDDNNDDDDDDHNNNENLCTSSTLSSYFSLPIELKELHNAHSDKKMIHSISRWLLDVVYHKLTPCVPNGLYLSLSEIHEGVFALRSSPPSSSSGPSHGKDASPNSKHCTIDSVEIRSLCQVVGSHGISALDKYLLLAFHDQTSRLKDLIREMQTELQELRTGGFKFETVKNMKQLNDMSKTLIMIGNILTLRELLYSGLGNVNECSIAAVHSELREKGRSLSGSSEKVLVKKHGIFNECTDPSVESAGHELNKTTADQSVWNLLPIAIATSFMSPLWRNAKFVPEHDVFDNNGQNMIRTIHTLFRVFKPELPQHASASKDNSEFCSCLKNAVYTISEVFLEMKTSLSEATSDGAVSIHSILLFLEKLADESPEMESSFLDTCFPHVLTHNASMAVLMKNLKVSPDQPMCVKIFQ